MIVIRTAKDDTGHWMAWLDGIPENAFGGSTAHEAMARLRVVTGKTCQECHGTGNYVGLTADEFFNGNGGVPYR